MAGIPLAHVDMPLTHERTAAATGEYVLESKIELGLVRRGLRVVATVGLLVAFGYCAGTAWGVLQGLGHVSVADVAQSLRMVSVRDAILCAVGWRIGRELVVTLLQARRAR